MVDVRTTRDSTSSTRPSLKLNTDLSMLKNGRRRVTVSTVGTSMAYKLTGLRE